MEENEPGDRVTPIGASDSQNCDPEAHSERKRPGVSVNASLTLAQPYIGRGGFNFKADPVDHRSYSLKVIMQHWTSLTPTASCPPSTFECAPAVTPTGSDDFTLISVAFVLFIYAHNTARSAKYCQFKYISSPRGFFCSVNTRISIYFYNKVASQADYKDNKSYSSLKLSVVQCTA